ncbi:MAG: putative rane protein [Ramlibacter sp.]|jgi:hypothetical protein|nr:putative rane protein [Ramlibacter sp.]
MIRPMEITDSDKGIGPETGPASDAEAAADPGPAAAHHTDTAADAGPGGETAPGAEPASPLQRIPLSAWLREGLRAGFLLRPRVGAAQPTRTQLLLVLLGVLGLQLMLARFEIDGPALFDLRGWLAPQWSTAVVLLLAWWVLPSPAPAGGTPAGVPAWFTLWMLAALPVTVVASLLAIADAHRAMPRLLAANAWAAWGVYFLLIAWLLVAAVRLTSFFGVARVRQAILVLGLAAVFGVDAWQFTDRPWQLDTSKVEAPDTPRLELSQQTFENQQALWRKTVDALPAQRPGVTDVYGLVFAPYAREDVFLRESSMVAGLLKDRFDARGVLHLLNNPATTQTHPWATPQNLERAIEALAGRMDRENDLLVVYMTSHGASDFKLAASHWPLSVETVSPGELRAALDKAGIRHRVIAISACYSGGWIEPLASETTLVMTAADAIHTSYGCGRLSPLTFFGRAVFDEQLRKTHSFEKAFAAAVPLIRQREIEAGKQDGFSNPQISIGEQIKPLLQSLEQRLDATP